MHCNENPIYGIPKRDLRGLSPNFHIHVSVSKLYIPRIGPHIFLQQNRQTDRGSIEIAHRIMTVEISFLGICFNFQYCVFAVHDGTYKDHVGADSMIAAPSGSHPQSTELTRAPPS